MEENNNDIITNGLKAYEAKIEEKNKKLKAQRKQWIICYLFFLLSAAAITYIFPSTDQFRYSYALGEQWGYETLEAPINFPIEKTKVELEKDRNELIRQYYSPYYHKDEAVEKRIITDIQKKGESIQKKYGVDYTSYIIGKLQKIFATGIISSEEYDGIEDAGISKIKVLEKEPGQNQSNAYSDTYREKVFTPKDAYKYITGNGTGDLPAYIKRNILLEYNIDECLKPTLIYEREKSALAKKEAISSISPEKGRVEYGKKIVQKGEVITEDTYQTLESLKHEMEKGQKGLNIQARIGQGICVICILTALFLYFVLFRDFYMRRGRMAFILGFIIGMCALTSYVTKMSYEVKEITVYLIPFAVVPITISAFFDTRTALFTHLTTVLLCSLIAPHEFEFILLQILIGMICISTLKRFYQRSQLFKTVAIIAGIYIITYVGLVLTHSSGWDENDATVILSLFINAGLLLFSYPLIYIFEKVFNFTSDITLVELTNSNNPLLRQFSEVAPGSFQHSLQVSNLASEAADCIKCNALLARAGALYHDIGKMTNAIYFTENQSGFNPHNKLTAHESVKVITNHVTDGLAIGRKNGLPQSILDFIESHHGKNPVRYFYNTYCNAHPDEKVNIKDFSYNGKLPSSKEEVIVMICDSVEAASRSLNEYTEEKINALIENIVAQQMKDGAYAMAPITFKELEDVKNILGERLKSLYHTRIRYPELNKDKQKE